MIRLRTKWSWVRVPLQSHRYVINKGLDSDTLLKKKSEPRLRGKATSLYYEQRKIKERLKDLKED